MHLAAELIENATAFSSAQVLVTAGMLNSGGALVEITDEGLGIADQDLADANWRLDHPPVIDVGSPAGWACSWWAALRSGTASGCG